MRTESALHLMLLFIDVVRTREQKSITKLSWESSVCTSILEQIVRIYYVGHIHSYCYGCYIV
jgi:hypothetical protein